MLLQVIIQPSPLFYSISGFICFFSPFICNFFCNWVPEEKVRKQQKCLHYVHTIKFQLSSFVSLKMFLFSTWRQIYTLVSNQQPSTGSSLLDSHSFGFTQQVFVRLQSGEFVAANQSPDVFNLQVARAKSLLHIHVTASRDSLQTNLGCSVSIDVLTCRYGIKTSIRFNWNMITRCLSRESEANFEKLTKTWKKRTWVAFPPSGLEQINCRILTAS